MAMGYQGFVRFFTTGPNVASNLLLVTGSSVNLVLEPIYSSAVLGYGWYNAAVASHYADAAIRFEGGVDFELQVGASGVVWNFIRDWAIEWRAWPRSLEISPDGQRIYEYITTSSYSTPAPGPNTGTFDNNGAWCTSLDMNTSEGSFVTCSSNVVAIYRTQAAGGDPYIDQRLGYIASDATAISNTSPLNPGGTNVNPIPFWKTDAQFYTNPYGSTTPVQAGSEPVDWSISLNNNHTVLYTCSGTRFPTAVLMGAIDATGNVTMYNNEGVFDPITGDGTQGDEEHPFRTAENTYFRVAIDAGLSVPLNIDLPAVVIEGDDYGIKGQSDVTTRGFTIKGLGSRIYNNAVMPPMVMSEAIP